MTKVQDPALGLVEIHTVGFGPSIQPVQIPLQSLPTFKQIDTPAQFGVIIPAMAKAGEDSAFFFCFPSLHPSPLAYAHNRNYSV